MEFKRITSGRASLRSQLAESCLVLYQLLILNCTIERVGISDYGKGSSREMVVSCGLSGELVELEIREEE